MYILMGIAIIVFIILAIFLGYYNRPESRGARGEKKVRKIIGETREDKQYVINDLILQCGEKTSQIDHIVINPYGVFVIETKNYSGNVYGAENQNEWTQVLAYGKVKNKVRNPLKQNATHVYNVKKVIGNFPVRSLVVFVQNNTYNIESNKVIPLIALKNELQCGKVVLSTGQMRFVYNALLKRKADVTQKQHVENIKEQLSRVNKGFALDVADSW